MKWLLRFALILLPGVAWAGTCNSVPCVGPIKNSFCALSSISSATAITTCAIFANTSSAKPNFAYITAFTASVNWTDDGTTPTTAAAGGQLISAGSGMWYSVGENGFAGLQFISATGGVTISFYR